MKMVKIDSKIIVLLPWSKSVKQILYVQPTFRDKVLLHRERDCCLSGTGQSYKKRKIHSNDFIIKQTLVYVICMCVWVCDITRIERVQKRENIDSFEKAVGL